VLGSWRNLKGQIGKDQPMIVAALAGALMLQAANAQIPPEYVEINSTLMRSCSRGAIDAEAGKVRPEALADCTASLQTEPLNRHGEALTLVNRGVIRLKSGDSAGALTDLNAAIEREPGLAAAWLNRAVVHIGASRYAEALADADRAVSLDNTNARAVFLRGGANELLGKNLQAYKDYQLAAKLDPAWDRPKTELARFQVKK
jgi:tetratricopeptide (TPR) repeat protein